MSRLLMLIALPVLGYAYWRYFARASAADRKRRLKKVLLALAALGLVVVVVRSGGALIGGLTALGMAALRALPHLVQLMRSKAPSAGPPPATGRARMTREEALRVLDLPESATREQIVERYRSLMKTAHPDRGGSSYLAAQINQAKQVLVG